MKSTPHAGNLLVQIVAILTIIPLAPFICRFIPPIMVNGWNIDLLVALIISLIVVRLILWLVQPLIFGVFFVLIGFLIYNEFHNKYSFSNVWNDYRTLVQQNWMVRNQKQNDALPFFPTILKNNSNKTAQLIKSKVQYNDSVVRNFSVQHSLQYFREYENKYEMLTRYFSLFKYINNHFAYVPDAQRDEYYATPKETILNGLGGDCDDHSILMAGCLMSVGAVCRLVIIEGHMYPEMYVGHKKEFEEIKQAIIQLFGNMKIDRIYFHETNGEYWINLDYTARYPGGPYLNDKVKLVIDL
jgi:hypothetical protein